MVSFDNILISLGLSNTPVDLILVNSFNNSEGIGLYIGSLSNILNNKLNNVGILSLISNITSLGLPSSVNALLSYNFNMISPNEQISNLNGSHSILVVLLL